MDPLQSLLATLGDVASMRISSDQEVAAHASSSTAHANTTMHQRVLSYHIKGTLTKPKSSSSRPCAVTSLARTTRTGSASPGQEQPRASRGDGCLADVLPRTHSSSQTYQRNTTTGTTPPTTSFWQSWTSARDNADRVLWPAASSLAFLRRTDQRSSAPWSPSATSFTRSKGSTRRFKLLTR